MKYLYLVTLIQDGNNLSGSGEKIKESKGTEITKYEPKKRPRIQIQGHILKRYLRHDIINIHIAEQGRQRDTTMIQELILNRHKELVGTFFSTAANTSGYANWEKNNNDN